MLQGAKARQLRKRLACWFGAVLIALAAGAPAAELSRDQVARMLSQSAGERAVFDGKDLSGADLSGLDLRGASFRKANLFAAGNGASRLSR